MTPCISSRPLSALGPSAFRLTLVSQADTECNIKKVCIILYLKKDEYYEYCSDK